MEEQWDERSHQELDIIPAAQQAQHRASPYPGSGPRLSSEAAGRQGGASFPVTGAQEWLSQPLATVPAALQLTWELRGAVIPLGPGELQCLILKSICNHIYQIRGSCQKWHIRTHMCVLRRTQLASHSKSYLIHMLDTGWHRALHIPDLLLSPYVNTLHLI